MIYGIERMHEEDVNNWLNEMNTSFQGFRPISISVNSGSGVWVTILYQLGKKKGAKSRK